MFSVIYYLLFIFSSCNQESQERNAINLTEQSELMMQDPVVTEYFSTMAAMFNLSREGDFTNTSYYAILTKENGDHCSIKKEAFDGNIDMENFAKIKCNLSSLGKKYREKYPEIRKMSRKDKAILLGPIRRKTAMAMTVDPKEAIAHAEKYYNQLSEKEKKTFDKEVEEMTIPKND